MIINKSCINVIRPDGQWNIIKVCYIMAKALAIRCCAEGWDFKIDCSLKVKAGR